MKAFTRFIFIITFIISFYFVGSMVVNSIITLFPVSISEWFPLIKFLLWVFTFSFNFILTWFIYFIVIFIFTNIFG